ncbi:hypothetical protein KC19_7G035200 [Ceratodon purpureus]|uniref:Uncharacterized protein n=1 Tax=Ceratodon purpureus TaxID=3225 RepID=A0A8T0H6Z1_CERPU|nr:hypothetical protein KC19_7G035200 [Ceratodon purpureus]
MLWCGRGRGSGGAQLRAGLQRASPSEVEVEVRAEGSVLALSLQLVRCSLGSAVRWVPSLEVGFRRIAASGIRNAREKCSSLEQRSDVQSLRFFSTNSQQHINVLYSQIDR